MSQAADHVARGDWQAADDAWSRTGPDGPSSAEPDSFGAVGVTSRTAAAAYAFEHGLV